LFLVRWAMVLEEDNNDNGSFRTREEGGVGEES
jgi:hypothetical protein